MPDNRQTSKQRRAARNRAIRAAREARSENARVAAMSRPAAGGGSTGAGAAPSGAGRRGGLLGGLLGGGSGRGRQGAPRPGGQAGSGTSRPGDRAVLVALVLAVLSGVVMLFLRVPVDDRGEPLPRDFRGVAVEARETLTGSELPDDSVTLLEANGASALLFIGLPVLVCAFAFWANRRGGPGRSRVLTFAMLAVAIVVLLFGGMLFLPSLVALGVASFQVRKADALARSAGQPAPAAAGGGVIDADSAEVDEDDDDETEPGDDGEADLDGDMAAEVDEDEAGPGIDGAVELDEDESEPDGDGADLTDGDRADVADEDARGSTGDR